MAYRTAFKKQIALRAHRRIVPTEATWLPTTDAAQVPPDAASGRPSTACRTKVHLERGIAGGRGVSLYLSVTCQSQLPACPLPPQACSPAHVCSADALAGPLPPPCLTLTHLCASPGANLSAQPPEASAEPGRKGSHTTSLASGDAPGRSHLLRVTDSPKFPHPCRAKYHLAKRVAESHGGSSLHLFVWGPISAVALLW